MFESLLCMLSTPFAGTSILLLFNFRVTRRKTITFGDKSCNGSEEDYYFVTNLISDTL